MEYLDPRFDQFEPGEEPLDLRLAAQLSLDAALAVDLLSLPHRFGGEVPVTPTSRAPL
jgi:hypothetical protein